MRPRLVPFLSALLASPVLALAQAPAPAPASAAAPASAPASAPARVVAPVIQLGVDVRPWYIAGTTYGAAPRVSIDPRYDALLSSSKRRDVEKAMQGIAAQPQLVKPETMIVLAMRLYDVGLRNDAVFWYYAGRDRFLTMEQVLDVRSLQLIRSVEVVDSFLRAAGPAMEGYAFCSVAEQEQLEDRAVAWVAAHPYAILGYTELPAVTEDRNAALADAVDKLRADARQKKAQLEDPRTLADLEAARAAAHAHERFCW